MDGKANTRWSSAFSDAQWIQVDLGKALSVCGISLDWEAAYGKAYQLQISNDAKTWQTIYSTSNGAGNAEKLTVSGNGRYIRMQGIKRGTPYGYSLFELQAYTTVSSS
ncbi:hypothetical protein KSX_13580 [Ktedonospora formicarum]|uniref:F5/8 type C domain-containing protein n=1 Tax=Ktedonospora formicarum TaxID=2778364 RepID=A0A8J3MPS0_9CHLR|nr:hypothetical protein KSX_13580 [Ktedonospora formicarum]